MMFADRRLDVMLCSILITLAMLATRAEAASVTIGEALSPNWQTGFCTACTISSVPTRYFTPFTLDQALTLTDASFAIREIPGFGIVTTSFSVSIWEVPLQGSALFLQDYAPGGYLAQDLGTGNAASGYVGLELGDWTLDPGTYWLSIFADASQGSLQWGSDGALGNGSGYVLSNGVWIKNPNPATQNVHLGFSLTGNTPATVPVPGTLGLLGIGLGALLATRRGRG